MYRISHQAVYEQCSIAPLAESWQLHSDRSWKTANVLDSSFIQTEAGRPLTY